MAVTVISDGTMQRAIQAAQRVLQEDTGETHTLVLVVKDRNEAGANYVSNLANRSEGIDILRGLANRMAYENSKHKTHH